jgi:hypothetical protein
MRGLYGNLKVYKYYYSLVDILILYHWGQFPFTLLPVYPNSDKRSQLQKKRHYPSHDYIDSVGYTVGWTVIYIY